jgi:hypothetical protein
MVLERQRRLSELNRKINKISNQCSLKAGDVLKPEQLNLLLAGCYLGNNYFGYMEGGVKKWEESTQSIIK